MRRTWTPACALLVGVVAAHAIPASRAWADDVRAALERRGVHVEGSVTADAVRNARGGVKRGSEGIVNALVQTRFDLERMFGWDGASVLLYGMYNSGGSVSALVGDAQGVDNIESTRRWAVEEAWIQQILGRNRFSLVAGLYDVNSEFDVIHTAELFVNSSHGIGAELAASGLVGPSIFPFTALSLRLKALVDRARYVQVLVADGVPGNPQDPARGDLSIGGGEGALVAVEAGWYRFAREDEPVVRPEERSVTARRKHIGREVPADYVAKVAVGAWGYTSRFEVVARGPDAPPAPARTDRGAYLLTDWRITSNATGAGLSGFARIGVASDEASRFRSYVGAGLVYTGFLPGRAGDRVGIAVARAQNSSYFLSVAPGAQERAETALEFTLRLELAPNLSLQPDLQYVIDPGTEPSLDDALVLGVRVEIAL